MTIFDFGLFGHRMIRSALAKTLGEIVKPICLAVFRLIARLEHRRLLDGEIGRLCAIQEPSKEHRQSISFFLLTKQSRD
jgi:hypothetical protein